MRNLTVIGDTGENASNGQKVLVRNEITGEIFTAPLSSVQKGIVTGMKGLGTRPKNNSTGYVGVIQKYGGYVARITIHRQLYWLGLFRTPEEASKAYEDAKMAWIKKHIKPVVASTKPKGASGIKNIHRTGRTDKPWAYQFVKNGKHHEWLFKTIDEAVEFKRKYLGGN